MQTLQGGVHAGWGVRWAEWPRELGACTPARPPAVAPAPSVAAALAIIAALANIMALFEAVSSRAGKSWPKTEFSGSIAKLGFRPTFAGPRRNSFEKGHTCLMCLLCVCVCVCGCGPQWRPPRAWPLRRSSGCAPSVVVVVVVATANANPRQKVDL